MNIWIKYLLPIIIFLRKYIVKKKCYGGVDKKYDNVEGEKSVEEYFPEKVCLVVVENIVQIG